MRAEGYGADLELAGEVVTVTARGLGKAALGAAQRQIPLSALISVDFKKANALVNGHIELVTVDGKTLVHFRRKQAATMRALYDEIIRVAPSVAQGAVDARVASRGQSSPTTQTPAAGWQDAPDRPGFWRWWDGQNWTNTYHPKDAATNQTGLTGTPVRAWAVQTIRHNVVGEQNYAAGFRRLLSQQGLVLGEYGATIEEARAAVVAEPNNTYDANAVAVYVQEEIVGYLPRDIAAAYSGALQDVAERGHHLATTARVWIAPDDDGRVASVTVELPPPEGVQSFNEPPEQPHQVLPGGAAVQVSGEDQHMDVLGAYVADQDRYLAVTLHMVEELKSERSTPYRAVEVRLADRRVGVLTKAMSEKVADIVDFVSQRGRIPVCRAVLKGSPLRAELVLYVAKSHEVTRRWMDSVPPA